MKRIAFNDKYNLTALVLNGQITQFMRIVDINSEKMQKFKLYYYENTLDTLDGIELAVAYFINNTLQLPFHSKDEAVILVPYSKYYTEETFGNTKGWNNKMCVMPCFMQDKIYIDGFKIKYIKDLTEEDYLKQGIVKSKISESTYYTPTNPSAKYETAKDAFNDFVNKVYGRKALDDNTIVIVYDFELG